MKALSGGPGRQRRVGLRAPSLRLRGAHCGLTRTYAGMTSDTHLQDGVQKAAHPLQPSHNGLMMLAQGACAFICNSQEIERIHRPA